MSDINDSDFQWSVAGNAIEEVQAIIEARRQQPTSTWDCKRCGTKVERYRGQSHVSCECGAQYNAGGQQLRDDWANNMSNYDEDISDMDGYELEHLREEY